MAHRRGAFAGHGRSVVAWVAAAALLVGCGKASSPNLVVKAPAKVNGGRPIYMMVRIVDPTTFTADAYQAMAAKVVAPDESVLRTEVIYPDTSPAFTLSEPAKGQLALYFFFTKPGGDWKTLLEKPLPKTIAIQLGNDRVEIP